MVPTLLKGADAAAMAAARALGLPAQVVHLWDAEAKRVVTNPDLSFWAMMHEDVEGEDVEGEEPPAPLETLPGKGAVVSPLAPRESAADEGMTFDNDMKQFLEEDVHVRWAKDAVVVGGAGAMADCQLGAEFDATANEPCVNGYFCAAAVMVAVPPAAERGAGAGGSKPREPAAKKAKKGDGL